MNAEMNFMGRVRDIEGSAKVKKDVIERSKEMGIVSEDCNCSVYSLLAVAGGILLAVGIVVYSLLTM